MNMYSLLTRMKTFLNGNPGMRGFVNEKRKFPRYPVERTVICHRFGKERSMRTVDIGLGGLKLESNFDIRTGESMDFAILTNSTSIRCKGTVLATEEFQGKVQARLTFSRTSDRDFRKLSNYLDTLSRGKGTFLQKGLLCVLLILSALIAYFIIRTYFTR